MDHPAKSNAEKLLIGTSVPTHGNAKITGITKHSANIRVVTLDNGKTIPLPTSRVKAFVDSQLRKTYGTAVQPIAVNETSKKFQALNAARQNKAGKGR